MFQLVPTTYVRGVVASLHKGTRIASFWRATPSSSSTSLPDLCNLGVGATCARQVFAAAYEILACLCWALSTVLQSGDTGLHYPASELA
jgi:hypothetical protein